MQKSITHVVFIMHANLIMHVHAPAPSKSKGSSYVLKRAPPEKQRGGEKEKPRTFGVDDRPPMLALPIDEKTKSTLSAMNSGRPLPDLNKEYVKEMAKVRIFGFRSIEN